MARTFVVEVIVTEEDTGFVYAVSRDEVPFDKLHETYQTLVADSMAEVRRGQP